MAETKLALLIKLLNENLGYLEFNISIISAQC